MTQFINQTDGICHFLRRMRGQITDSPPLCYMAAGLHNVNRIPGEDC
jgi:hypothetical protein